MTRTKAGQRRSLGTEITAVATITPPSRKKLEDWLAQAVASHIKRASLNIVT